MTLVTTDSSCAQPAGKKEVSNCGANSSYFSPCKHLHLQNQRSPQSAPMLWGACSWDTWSHLPTVLPADLVQEAGVARAIISLHKRVLKYT